MKNLKRKEELKKLALKKPENGGRIYQLICSNKIDHIIDLITDEKTETIITSIVEKGYITGNEQFIDMLSNFMYYFDMVLPTVSHKDLMIEMILETQTPEFLLCKKYWGDNNNIDYFKNSIEKTLVTNFYHNMSFVGNCPLFKKYGVTLPGMNLDNREDLDKVFKLMKDILWTNIGEYSTVYLFDEFGANEKAFKKHHKDMKRAEILGIISKNYKMHFEMLIDRYEDNKNILEFIK